mmetsp:Transcript_45228/g.90326  ORF Transcript_45228/g.90326 Transcript_45228/m.90326 type:complete len:125 (-) Transcript_45228:469-843(-)
MSGMALQQDDQTRTVDPRTMRDASNTSEQSRWAMAKWSTTRGVRGLESSDCHNPDHTFSNSANAIGIAASMSAALSGGWETRFVTMPLSGGQKPCLLRRKPTISKPSAATSGSRNPPPRVFPYH